MTELELLVPWFIGLAGAAGFFFGRWYQVRRDLRRYRLLEHHTIELREQVSLQYQELEHLRVQLGGAEGLTFTAPPPPEFFRRYQDGEDVPH